MLALVATAAGTFSVDLDSEEVDAAEPFLPPLPPAVNLPRVVAAAAAGSTVVVAVDARPPILVSYDSGSTWRESGRGLPGARRGGGGGRSRHARVRRAQPALRLA